MLIMQFVVAWNYFKMLMVIAERYVLLGVFSYTAPLAFATGGSKATNNILASWSKMFGGQVVLVILNAWCMKMFLSGYGNMMASSYGFTKFFAATLCLVGFCKITFKLDSYMASLGVNLWAVRLLEWEQQEQCLQRAGSSLRQQGQLLALVEQEMSVEPEQIWDRRME